jgi:nitrogen PTS system EIIA component
MEIEEFLSPAATLIDFRASDKAHLLRELCQRAASSLHLEADLIARDILKRENLGSTGVGGGVAIPHARIPGLKKPFSIFVRLKTPIEFDSVDGQAVDIIFLLLLPATPSNEQLKSLAGVARRLRATKTIDDLRHAASPGALYKIMTAAPNNAQA